MGTTLNNIGKVAALLLVIVVCASCSSPKDYDQLVTISTRLGDIKLVLFDDTPKHKASFLELAEDGAYDSTTFYRVLKNFIIQGGDISVHPTLEHEARRLIPAEISPKHIHQRGMIGAARQSINHNPYKESTTQFYIVQGRKFNETELTTEIGKLNAALPKFLYNGNHEELIAELKKLQDEGKDEELQQRIIDLRQEIEETLGMNFENTKITPEQIKIYTTIGGAPHLDGDYTVFGQVVDGIEVVDKIAALKVDSVDNPLEPVYMKLTIEKIPKDSITARYGYKYPTTRVKEGE